jgi:AraC-like DNA-binding protein
MQMMTQAYYEEVIFRAGMQVDGGNLTRLPQMDPVSSKSVGSAAWAGRGMGLFVVDYPGAEVVELNALVLRDVIACAVVLNEAATKFAVAGQHFTAEASDMTMIFVPRGERFQFETRTEQGLRAVTIVIDLKSMMESYGLSADTLPKSILRTINGRETIMDKLTPGHFGSIAIDVASRHGMFPSIAPIYYEGKSLELISTLLNQVSRRDAVRVGDDVFDLRTFERLEQVKKIIDQAPHRPLDIVALERVAAMNRTKLRCSFKQAYGTTLSAYRATVLLQLADRELRESSCSVQQAAYHAGYAAASSFIVAYKRQYGMSPGDVRQQRISS